MGSSLTRHAVSPYELTARIESIVAMTMVMTVFDVSSVGLPVDRQNQLRFGTFLVEMAGQFGNVGKIGRLPVPSNRPGPLSV